jgi:hypothetical protein
VIKHIIYSWGEEREVKIRAPLDQKFSSKPLALPHHAAIAGPGTGEANSPQYTD